MDGCWDGSAAAKMRRGMGGGVRVERIETELVSIIHNGTRPARC